MHQRGRGAAVDLDRRDGRLTETGQVALDAWLLRREHDKEIEFVTMMWFASIEAVRAFAGDDYTRAVVPAKAQALLARYDQRSAHFEVREDQRPKP